MKNFLQFLAANFVLGACVALVAFVAWGLLIHICTTINHAEGAAYHHEMLDTFGPKPKINTP